MDESAFARNRRVLLPPAIGPSGCDPVTLTSRKTVSERERKIAAMLLSGLVAAEESQLDDFRRTRLGRTGAGLEDLRLLRELLLRLGEALRVGDAEAMQAIRAAHAAMAETPQVAPVDPRTIASAPLPTDASPAAVPAPSPIEVPERSTITAIEPPLVVAVEPPPISVEASLEPDEDGPATPPLLEAPPATLPPSKLATVLPFGHGLPSVDATSVADEHTSVALSLERHEVIPFVPGEVARPSVRLDPEPPTSASEEVAPLSQSLDTPVPPRTELAERIGAEPLPFRRSLPSIALADDAPIPELTLEAYASMRALASAFPERRRDTLRRYGIGDDVTADRLDARWAVRFEAEPELAARYLELFEQYRAWFEANG